MLDKQTRHIANVTYQSMNFRRYYVPNAIVFITQVVHGRESIFAVEQHVQLLLAILREAKERYPFQMVAYVFLPDHFHIMIKPDEGITHSQIMLSVKPNFTKAYKNAIGIQGSMQFWQKRYWDHIIRDEADFAHHLDYIHYNPVKHGYVTKPEDWLYSSYRHWQAKDAYPERWGWSLPQSLQNLNTAQWE